MKTGKRYGGLLRVSGGAAGGLAAAVCLLVWGCPLALMPDLPAGIKTATGGDGGGGDLVVREYNLQAYVPAPTAGAAPVKAVEGRRDLEGSVVWTDAEGQALAEGFAVFELGAVYRAAITLRVKGDYSFDPALSFKYYPADAVADQSADDTADGDAGRKQARSVTVTYKAAGKPIPIAAADFDLTLHVPRPVPGGSPVRTFYTGTFGGNVEWTAVGPDGGPLDGGPMDGLFLAGADYSAAVSLYPGPGYVFPGGSIPVTHSGAVSSPVSFAAGSGGTAAGVLRFPETTGVPEVVAVDELDLTYKIPAPVTGGTPVTYLSAPQYAGNVSWADDGDVAHSGLFEKGTAYTATVALKAASGFTFTGVGANAFRHDRRDTKKSPNPANEAGSGTVTIVFPATTEEQAAVVNDLDLTDKIPAPTAEGIPVAYFFPPLSPQYTGNVAWSTGGLAHSGLFQEGMAYTATVTLTAASGFTFTGVKENAFTHNGTANVTNAADPETVIIVFPAPGGGKGKVEFLPGF